MAFFSKKNSTAAKPAEEKKAVPAQTTTAKGMKASTSHVLTNPRVTEKATMHEAGGVYTFDVSVDANKRQIIEAVRELYKVTPRMVRVVTIPAKLKRNARTGKPGVKHGGKKAYVFLKKGDTIAIR